jgi:hypothetical protein
MNEWLPRPSRRTRKKTLRRTINDVLDLPAKLRATAAHCRQLAEAAEDRLHDAAYDLCAAAQDLAPEDLSMFGAGMPGAVDFLRNACARDHTGIEPAARVVDMAFVPSPAEALPLQVAKFEGHLLVLRSYVRGLDEATRVAEGGDR